MLYITGSGPPYGTALRGLADAGMDDLPVASQTANMTTASVTQYKDILPKTALHGVAGLALAATPRGPIPNAQRLYVSSFDAAHLKIDGVNVSVWDPAWILIAALRHVGPAATPVQLRDEILHLHARRRRRFPLGSREIGFRPDQRPRRHAAALIQHRRAATIATSSA